MIPVIKSVQNEHEKNTAIVYMNSWLFEGGHFDFDRLKQLAPKNLDAGRIHLENYAKELMERRRQK